MTDKSAPPLNLIERMAQRLEKEAAGSQAAPGANVIGRAMERDIVESEPVPRSTGAQPVTMREPVQAQPAGRREGRQGALEPSPHAGLGHGSR